MPGVYKEIRQLRAKVRAAELAVREARTLLATWREACDGLLQDHAAMSELLREALGSGQALTKTAEEDRRRGATILAEVQRLEAELAAVLAEPR